MNSIELEKHEGVLVARDMLPGGTKSRYLWQLYQRTHEIVYATSAEGSAQVALAATAQRHGKRAVIFGPQRSQLHPRQKQAIALGAMYIPTKPGYLNVCQKRAADWAQRRGAMLLPFGARTENAPDIIAECADDLKVKPDYIWCASGSGTLIQGLMRAWPKAKAHVVQVGHELTPTEANGATVHVYPKPYVYRSTRGTI